MTNTKGGFGVASDWPQLNLLACKIGIVLVWQNAEAIDLMNAGNLNVVVNGEMLDFNTTGQLRIKMQDLQLNKEMEELMSLQMQRKLVNLSFIGYFLSQDIFKNVQFADKLVQFWYKMRHNVLSCNFTLSKWYGVDAKCVIDGYRIESMADLLNSCKEFKRNYSARHDEICNKLCFELTGLWSCIHLNKTAKTSFPELNLVPELQPLKPDLVLKGHDMVIIADVACPYDLYADEVYKAKIEKYGHLTAFIASKYRCVFLPVVIGSCGFVHKKTLGNLIKLGLNKRRAKGLCKYFSNSNIFFARNIWNKRCSLVHD